MSEEHPAMRAARGSWRCVQAHDKPGWLADAHRIYGDALRREKKKTSAVAHYELYLELAPLDALDRPDVEKWVEDLKR